MYPKKVRIQDSAITRKARKRDIYCLYGVKNNQKQKKDPFYRCWVGTLDGHHIIPVGVGGPDVMENVISLCRKHHIYAEDRRISPDELRAILTHYYGFQYDENGCPISENK